MILLVVLATSTPQAFAVTFADSFSVTGPASPIPGYSPVVEGEWTSYVSSNSDFMLVTHGYYTNRQVAGRTLDSETGTWGSPVDLLPKESSGGSLSPDGNSMYYYAPGTQQSDIWRSHRTLEGWSAGEIVVSTAGADHHPMLGGNKLVFEHVVGSGYPLDIWQADYDPITDQFSTPTAININTNDSEGDPWISGDGSLLIFNSDRPGGHGGWDLWYATWDDTLHAWNNVTNFGPNINTAGNETQGCVAEQAGFLFFGRDGVLLQAAVPEPSTLVLLGAGALSLLGYAWRRRRQMA
jgi:hypothetical protein